MNVGWDAGFLAVEKRYKRPIAQSNICNLDFPIEFWLLIKTIYKQAKFCYGYKKLSKTTKQNTRQHNCISQSHNAANVFASLIGQINNKRVVNNKF